MKKTLLAGTTALMTLFNASAADCGCTETTVCDEEKLDLTGAWLGAGVIVDFDKYDADISVAAEYAGLQDIARTADVGTAEDALATAITKQAYDVIYAHLTTENDAGKGAGTLAPAAAGALGATSANTAFGQPGTYFAHRTLKLKKTKTVAGGELKGSLFYNVDNGLVFGVDLSLGLTAKSKKTIDVNGKFAARPANLVTDSKIYSFDYDGTSYASTVAKVLSGTLPISRATVVTPETVGTDEHVLGTQHNVLANFSFAEDTVAAANAGADVCGEEHSSFIINKVANNQRQAMEDVDGKVASAEFEKDIFSPTLAVVVGGYFKGFFGGLRLGMNYMTGKIHNLKNVDGSATHTASHKIRQVSPVIGIQLMKHIKKGVFAYLTYDHMFGINKTFLDSPIKKFKRRQNRISLGLGYQFKANH